MNLLSEVEWDSLDMEEILANSYRDFHAKGVDYLCLKRTPDLTLKVYFFEGDAQRASEVVNPHDHRYNFNTQVLSGAVRNVKYEPAHKYDPNAKQYNWLHYRTPLNGGDGFTWMGDAWLKPSEAVTFRDGDMYYMESYEYHTIRIVERGTILVLAQFEDVYPTDMATYTFTQSETAPSLDGLYSELTADQAVNRIKVLRELCGSY